MEIKADCIHAGKAGPSSTKESAAKQNSRCAQNTSSDALPSETRGETVSQRASQDLLTAKRIAKDEKSSSRKAPRCHLSMSPRQTAPSNCTCKSGWRRKKNA